MLGKIVFTFISVACLFTAAVPASAQQSSPSGETAPAASPSNDTSAVSEDIDALLAPSTDAAPASSQPPSSADATPADSSQPNGSATSAASPAANAPANAEGDHQSVPAPDATKDSGASYASIPVAANKDQAETVQPVREAPAHLEEIVVTATKRPELVRDIPASISVLTGQKLEDMGAHELKDFIQSVPGINSQDEIAGIQRKLAVRGVGPDTGTNQTVGIVYGDVALSDPYGSYTIADPDPWDLSTVEVLKGPQGTLFGATSLAGVIRYVPNTPQLGNWGGQLSADWVHMDYGGSDPSFGVMLNAPIGDTVALRVAGSWQHKPGLIDIENPAYSKENADDTYTRTGRIMALWQPNDQFALNAWYIKGQRSANELGYVSNPNGQYIRTDSTAPSPVENGYSLATLDARYTFDWATLVSISAYQTKSSFNQADASDLVDPLAELGIRTLTSVRHVNTNGYQQEFRLVSPSDGPWTWITGAYLSTYKANINSSLDLYPGLAVIANLLNVLPSTLTSSLYNQYGIIVDASEFRPVKASEKALFGELSREIGDDWKLTLGGRLYNAGVSGTVITSGAASVLGGPSTNIVNSDGKGFSPKVSATWHCTDEIMAYGTISRGFQYGGFNIASVTAVPPTYKSSTLWNYELGVRTDWLDRTLRFDLTGFYDPWKNPQVFQGTSNQLSGYTANVGAARSIGAETTLSYLTPIPGLTLETVASYIVANTTVPYTDSNGKVIALGTTLPSSPKVQETTTISYAFDLGSWHTQTAVVQTYQGTAWNDIEHDAQVGGYSMLNLNFAISRNDLSYAPSLSFSINNLTNVDALSSVLPGSPTIPGNPQLSDAITPVLRVYTLPRTLRLNLSIKF